MGVQNQEDSTVAATPLARKKPQRTSKEVQFAVLPDKYEPLIEEVEEEEEQETEEERKRRKEEKKSRKKRRYKKYRKVSGTFDLRGRGVGRGLIRVTLVSYCCWGLYKISGRLKI